MLLLAFGGFMITLQQRDLDVQSKQATIDYWLEKREEYDMLEGNTITFNCKNAGELDGSFYMLVNLANASFSTQTSMPYLQENDKVVKFGYTAHADESYQKTVYFNIDENVNGFSLSLSLEKRDNNPLKPIRRYPCSLSYEWNEGSRCFKLVE